MDAWVDEATLVRVSILIRPEGRMQRVGSPVWSVATPRFNPHPAFWPDATTPAGRWRGRTACFNPHPAFWPDATKGPRGRDGPPAGFNPHPAFWPDATRLLIGLCNLRSYWFQSSSGLLAGCNRRLRLAETPGSRSFNPHPARRPDATTPGRWRWGWSMRFNPHPARRPDATAQPGPIFDHLGAFQSSSGQKAGCNHRDLATRHHVVIVSILIRPEGRMQPGVRAVTNPSWVGFNPHPARRPDATTGRLRFSALLRSFQSSSGQKAGCNRACETDRSSLYKVSILIRPEGRMQRWRICSGFGPCWSSFNPHPARRPDATKQVRHLRAFIRYRFNPHPARRPDATA